MDLSTLRSTHRISKLVRIRIQELQNSVRSFAMGSPTLRVLVLTCLALGFGYLADQGSRTRALEKWEQENRPPELLLIQSLVAMGYTHEKAPELREKLYRALPSRNKTQPVLWFSDDGTWMSWFSSSEDLPQVYRRPHSQGTLRQKWNSVPLTWKGFLNLVHLLSTRFPSVPPQPKLLKKDSTDPKRFHY